MTPIADSDGRDIVIVLAVMPAVEPRPRTLTWHSELSSKVFSKVFSTTNAASPLPLTSTPIPFPAMWLALIETVESCRASTATPHPSSTLRKTITLPGRDERIPAPHRDMRLAVTMTGDSTTFASYR